MTDVPDDSPGGVPQDLDARLAEIIEIRERLEVVEDPIERQRLLDRRRELRTPPSSDLTSMSDEQLVALKAALEAQAESLRDLRLNIAHAGAGGPWNDGLDPVATMQHNQRVDESSGLRQVEERLSAVNIEISNRR